MNGVQRALLGLLGPLAPQLAVGNGLKPAWISRDAAVVRAYVEDPLVHDRVTPMLVRFIADGGEQVRRVAARWCVPTLLLWAGADRCVAPAGSAAFAAAAPRAWLTHTCYPQMAHEIFNEPEREQPLAELTRWLGTLPFARRCQRDQELNDERTRLRHQRHPGRLGRRRPAPCAALPTARGTSASCRRSSDYIEVPAKSPMFDADWQQHGYIDRVVRDAASWVESRKVAGLKLEVVRLEGRTPVILFEVPATQGRQHRHGGDVRPPRQAARIQRLAQRSRALDAQARQRPALRPRRRRRWLCGVRGDHRDRGARRARHPAPALRRADRELRRERLVRPAGLPRRAEAAPGRRRAGRVPRLAAPATTTSCGSPRRCAAWCQRRAEGRDPHRRRALGRRQRAGAVELSHPAPVARPAGRFSSTGRLLPESFHCEVPATRVEQARAAAATLGDEVWKRFPWACGADGGASLPTTTDPVEALLNRTWRPTLSVTGVDGCPELGNAGNVLRPYTAFKLSLRLPPLVDGNEASVKLKALLEDNAPYNAKVTFQPDGRAGASGATGWNAPAAGALAGASTERRLARALRRAARLHRPGRHDPADEHAGRGLSRGADDGVRRARAQEQRTRAERVPARAVRKRLTAAVAQVIAACP